ncbi:hypothetical protein OG840_61745 [Streptomyces sp. NBC_01764]|uniref:DUF6372 family protein n=1 Tax=Streptomyces sp. NBC_01764 TaxID=2975935 RepID=UPI00225437B3|nr:DUF6372 family protein [Streptomyces sp. NBC_01764]MCX4411617.1 hypothetical protein [Streptomyces sp. NBC_01764]
MAGEPAYPVLYLTMTLLFTWEQHRPGGCRCVCRIYHHGDGTCSAAAEPGRLLRVVAPATLRQSPPDITDALPVCAPCYTAVAPLSEPGTPELRPE